jgi:hypothetical protein
MVPKIMAHQLFQEVKVDAVEPSTDSLDSELRIGSPGTYMSSRSSYRRLTV